MLSKLTTEQIRKEGVSVQTFIDELYEANGTGSGAQECFEIAELHAAVWKEKALAAIKAFESAQKVISVMDGPKNLTGSDSEQFNIQFSLFRERYGEYQKAATALEQFK